MRQRKWRLPSLGECAMRDIVVEMQSSRIREVANAALKNPDVLAFWFGESDEVTPLAVREAAMRSLQRGETFYGHNLGLRYPRKSPSRFFGPQVVVELRHDGDHRLAGARPVVQIVIRSSLQRW